MAYRNLKKEKEKYKHVIPVLTTDPLLQSPEEINGSEFPST